MSRAPIPILLIALVLAAPGCRRSRQSPEEQVRMAIDSVVKAVGERDIKPIANAVSEQYADGEGNDKQRIVSLVRVQFVLHPNLYLVAKISSVECAEPAAAHVIIYAAMASVPSGVLPDLRNLSVDVYRFDLTLADEDGAWRVRKAAWTPATARDLL